MATFLDSLAAGRTLEGFDAGETELLLRAAVELLPQEPAMRVAEWLDTSAAEPLQDQLDGSDFDFGSGSDELDAEADSSWLTDFGEDSEPSSAAPLDDDDDMGEWDDTWSLGHVEDHGDADDHDAGLGHHGLVDPLHLTEDHGPDHHDD